jgi:hypothetical protein
VFSGEVEGDISEIREERWRDDKYFCWREMKRFLDSEGPSRALSLSLLS